MRHLCVFCGSKDGVRPVYRQAAHQTGLAIARAGLGLVYGGAASGLMGAVADGVLEGGQGAVGVIPRGLRGLTLQEFAHPRLTTTHVVGSMHERKALMHELSDGFLALPGGFGTLDELFETLTWSQLGMHAKPIGLLDVEGYFGPLMALVRRGLDEGFVPRALEHTLIVDPDPVALVRRVRAAG
jgi:hypothetical protein